MKNNRRLYRFETENSPSEQLSFDSFQPPVSVNEISAPLGYRGLSAFHKYWGKKPIECLGFLVEKLTNPNDIVVDPFIGSGLIARECALRNRIFIGIDINPISIELARMISDLPTLAQYDAALNKISSTVKQTIEDSYLLDDGKPASHYLWNKEILKEVWISRKGKGIREVRVPTEHDLNLSRHFSEYETRYIRPLKLFQNTRINTTRSLSLADIFTGRALRNIDLIIENIPPAPERVRRALMLTLTASIGQMSRMVFAITGRGKQSGNSIDKIEVGSWVIGYWRPPLHFEINVWNCFQNRASKLISALSDLGQPHSFIVSNSLEVDSIENTEITLLNEDSIRVLKQLPKASVSLVLTDPPHSDRIPYLELSELWNAILGKEPVFPDEIVVSNAREREKTKAKYNQKMRTLLEEVDRILVPGGTLALLFNARDAESWTGLFQNNTEISLRYYGCFPMTYSANSVIQDNRSGSMKSDYVLIYRKTGKGGSGVSFEKELHTIPGWSEDFPLMKGN